MAEPTPEEKAAQEAAAAEAAKAKAEADAAEAKRQEAAAAALGDPGKAALDNERKARKEAEKAARDAQAKLDKIEADSLTETERLKREAEKGQEAAKTATEKLRKANLITALAEKGIVGAKAKAAARLLDTVEYDDTDEPKNLDDAIKNASAEYGEDQFKTAGNGQQPPPNVNGGAGNQQQQPPSLTAEELQAAEAFGMTPEEYQAEKDPSYTPPVNT